MTGLQVWQYDIEHQDVVFDRDVNKKPFQDLIIKALRAFATGGERFYSYYDKHHAPAGIILYPFPTTNDGKDSDSDSDDNNDDHHDDAPRRKKKKKKSDTVLLQEAQAQSIKSSIPIPPPAWGSGGSNSSVFTLPASETKKMIQTEKRCEAWLKPFGVATAQYTHWYMPTNRRAELIKWAMCNCNKDIDIDHIPITALAVIFNLDINNKIQSLIPKWKECIVKYKWVCDSGILSINDDAKRSGGGKIKPSTLSARMRVYLAYCTIINGLKESHIAPQYVDAMVQRFMYAFAHKVPFDNNDTNDTESMASVILRTWPKSEAIKKNIKNITEKLRQPIHTVSVYMESLNNQFEADVFTFPGLAKLAQHGGDRIMPPSSGTTTATTKVDKSKWLTCGISYYTEDKFVKRLAHEGHWIALTQLAALKRSGTGPGTMVYMEIKRATPSSVSASFNQTSTDPSKYIVFGIAYASGRSAALLAIHSSYWISHQVLSAVHYTDKIPSGTPSNAEADSNDMNGVWTRYSLMHLLHYLKMSHHDIVYWNVYIKILRMWTGLSVVHVGDGLTNEEDRTKLKSVLSLPFHGLSIEHREQVQLLNCLVAFTPSDGLVLSRGIEKQMIVDHLDELKVTSGAVSLWRLVIDVIHAAAIQNRSDIILKCIGMVCIQNKKEHTDVKASDAHMHHSSRILEQKTNAKGFVSQFASVMERCCAICDSKTVTIGGVLEQSLESKYYTGVNWVHDAATTPSWITLKDTLPQCLSLTSYPIGMIQIAKSPKKYMYMDEQFIVIQNNSSDVVWRIRDCIIKWSKTVQDNIKIIAPPPPSAAVAPVEFKGPPTVRPSIRPQSPTSPSRHTKRDYDLYSPIVNSVHTRLQQQQQAKRPRVQQQQPPIQNNGGTTTTITIVTQTNPPIVPTPHRDDDDDYDDNIPPA